MIINADDFGLTESCTTAIAQAFKQGLITDTTMVANGEAYEMAVALAKDALKGHVGIHFNLTEGKPLTKEMSDCPTFCANGLFHKGFSRLKPLKRDERAAVKAELEAQITRLKDSGLDIKRADSHHHIHTSLWIAPIFADVCRKHGITTVRLHRNIGTISRPKLIIKRLYNNWLRRNFNTTQWFGSPEDYPTPLPTGTIEVMVHPDLAPDGSIIDRLADKPLAEYLGKSLVGSC